MSGAGGVVVVVFSPNWTQNLIDLQFISRTTEFLLLMLTPRSARHSLKASSSSSSRWKTEISKR
jgi:hypothetical protein